MARGKYIHVRSGIASMLSRARIRKYHTSSEKAHDALFNEYERFVEEIRMSMPWATGRCPRVYRDVLATCSEDECVQETKSEYSFGKKENYYGK